MSENNEKKSKFPPWLKKRISWDGKFNHTQATLDDLRLATVCSNARCPNRHECYNEGTATFMILGTNCTRRCRFCAIGKDAPKPIEHDEPDRVAEAARRLGLEHVVVTSVTRDDLDDGGSEQFACTIAVVRRVLPEATVEVLTPDFLGCAEDIRRVAEAGPDVYNHNVETVPDFYEAVRPGADFGRSVALLKLVKDEYPDILTKSGIMLGLGETVAQVESAMKSLRKAGCDLLTLGQYLAPSKDHINVVEFVEPAQFDEYAKTARKMGFIGVASGPFVRSSYHASRLLRNSRCT